MLRDIVLTSDIYVDGNQDYAAALKGVKGFTICQLPCDLAWVDKNGKLVGVEEKKSGDFATSSRSRRLARQLRGIKYEADIPVIGLRMSPGLYSDLWSTDINDCLSIAEWAPRGLVLLLPSNPDKMSDFLPRLREALEKENVRVLAGNDRKRPTDISPFRQALMRLFTGCGKVTAAKIDTYFRERRYSLSMALSAPNEMWKKAGAHKGVIKQLEVLR
jgi:ERCC4-type nuclease